MEEAAVAGAFDTGGVHDALPEEQFVVELTECLAGVRVQQARGGAEVLLLVGRETAPP
ncbi:hypothetical protein WKI68_37870 [Streptomyces sp. MS1.HAVA.3]|uniref:Uncharacterized protein n=1 Tax=Streptomyces caledonius TaxID=3134107 RepID=A0ABU8UC37_9ACTN